MSASLPTVSDAVFVESGGPAFAVAALGFLVRTLNFGHFAIASEPASSEVILVKTRTWFLDPYMSDDAIRQLLRLFSASSRRLEGRPTGTKCSSEISRMNVHGQHDEHQHFFERWCVLL